MCSGMVSTTSGSNVPAMRRVEDADAELARERADDVHFGRHAQFDQRLAEALAGLSLRLERRLEVACRDHSRLDEKFAEPLSVEGQVGLTSLAPALVLRPGTSCRFLSHDALPVHFTPPEELVSSHE